MGGRGQWWCGAPRPSRTRRPHRCPHQTRKTNLRRRTLVRTVLVRGQLPRLPAPGTRVRGQLPRLAAEELGGGAKYAAFNERACLKLTAVVIVQEKHHRQSEKYDLSRAGVHLPSVNMVVVDGFSRCLCDQHGDPLQRWPDLPKEREGYHDRDIELFDP